MFIVSDNEVTTLTRSNLCNFFSMVSLLHTKVLGMCAKDKSRVIRFFCSLGFSSSHSKSSPPKSCSRKRMLEEDTIDIIDELISKRLMHHDYSGNSLYFDLKEEVKAQGKTILWQSDRKHDLLYENGEFQSHVDALKEEMDDLKPSISSHGEHLPTTEGQVFNL